MLFGLGLLVTGGELIRVVITDRAARKGTFPRARRSCRRSCATPASPCSRSDRARCSAARSQHALRGHEHIGAIAGVLVGVGTGLVGYLVVQSLLNAPELPGEPSLRARVRAAVERGRGVNPIILVMLVPILAGMIWVGIYVARNPVWAAYIFLATQPFVGGIDRGKLIPLLRPSEAIQFGLMAAVLARRARTRVSGRTHDRPHHAGSTAPS